jgi:hypothetical protein
MGSTSILDQELRSLTVVGNTAEAILGGGGIHIETGTEIKLYGSILADNTSPAGPYNCRGDGTIAAMPNSYNLESSNTCGFSALSGDLVGTDPQLSPLATYSAAFDDAPRRMLAPFEASPAVDAIPAVSCPTNFDQRDVQRFGAPCTIGAFEGSVPRPVTPSPTPSATAPPPAPPATKKKCKKGQKLKKVKGKRKCVKKKRKKK